MDAAVIVIAAVSIVLLLAAAVRTDRRYARFARLPTHFDLRGRADAFGPRMVILWVVPMILMTTLAGIAALMVVLPAEAQNGNPVVGILIASVSMLGAQGLIVWPLARWAATQDL
ncbi:DUF1648 domain-containing protein [Altererythrobacter aerius]|uniref:DUF1648 domain-containing protein n=1 Tax=Tsuneonella aeria TaxID=1837929 RepID=A0A6I4TC94_9SPHN|nr:DUF1648 domain-containing protein [Tsuneonella aeria]MXO74673.1 DUF1648 domain-containing protein [Tsuneonella aeria]